MAHEALVLAAAPHCPTGEMDVLLMPEGIDAATLQARAGWIADVCKRTGYRYCPRLHVELYGNTRGT